ncbi:MAG: peptidyl-prolyl cis-trans isomerase, partial [candidate division Zixibacteria bacterium]|nr:peptidyl-prolyl cis-trans isomerase [candidate division Zixibacteria bacterium]
YVDDREWCGIVNGKDTLDGALIKSLEEPFRRRYKVDSTTAEMRREMIIAASEPYRIVEEARKRGYDTLPGVVDRLDYLWHTKAKALILQKRRGNESYDPSDAAIEKYYNDHIDEYVVEKPLTIQHLKVKDSALAVFLHAQAQTGIELYDLALDYGEAQGYDVKFEDVGKIGEKDVDRGYYRAALRVRDGSIADLATTPKGYFVIKVLERQRSKTLPSVTGTIRGILRRIDQRRAWMDFRDSLYQEYDVKFPGELRNVSVPVLSERKDLR